MLHPFSRSTDVSNGLSSRLLSVRLPCVRPFERIMPFVHSPKGKALVLAVHSRETRNFSRETRLVSRETRHVSRETRRVSRDGGNLHLSGTVKSSLSLFRIKNGSRPITKVKSCPAASLPGWVTTWVTTWFICRVVGFWTNFGLDRGDFHMPPRNRSFSFGNASIFSTSS